MSCPNCDHTMHNIDTDTFVCPRCGTVKQLDYETRPKLCRDATVLVGAAYALVAEIEIRDVFTGAYAKHLLAETRQALEQVRESSGLANAGART